MVNDGKLNFNTDKGRAALQLMQDVVYKHKIAPRDSANYTHVELYRDVQAGLVGIGRLGSWNIPAFDKPLNGDYVTAPFPPPQKGATALQSSIYHVLTVSRNTQKKEAALKWIKFLVSKPAQETIYKTVGLTMRTDLDWNKLGANERALPFVKREYKQAYLVTDPRWTADTRAIFARHTQKVLFDPNAKVADVLKAAEDEIAPAFKS